MRRASISSWAFTGAISVFLACSGSKTTDYEYVVQDAGVPTGGASGSAGGPTDAADAESDEGVAVDTADAADAGATFRDFGEHGRLLYVKASNPDAMDQFGTAVAISGDWLAVGAPKESSRAAGINGDQTDDSEDSSGAVYLFSDDGAGWAQRAYVKASNPEAVDVFGTELAMDGNTLAVAAWAEDGDATGVNGEADVAVAANAGAVYVFAHSNGAWEQEAYVKASNTELLDFFGRSVAVSGDTLVVGAPGEDSDSDGVNGNQSSNQSPASGAVYVFVRGSSWTQQAYLKASNPGVDDVFGEAIALDGDTLVVGAPGEASASRGVVSDQTDDSAPASGAVYVFERTSGTWRQIAYLKSSNTDADDQFGAELALDGTTLAVAAPREGTRTDDRSGTVANNLAPESGAVYVFERGPSGWLQQAYLKASNAETEDFFGVSVALLGDTLIVGALGEDGQSSPTDNNAPLSGAAYVFVRTGTTWVQQAYKKAPNLGVNDRFGAFAVLSPTMLAISSTVEASDSPGLNGDWSNDRMPGAGAVFVWLREP
jgi:hypothetical protein